MLTPPPIDPEEASRTIGALLSMAAQLKATANGQLPPLDTHEYHSLSFTIGLIAALVCQLLGITGQQFNELVEVTQDAAIGHLQRRTNRTDFFDIDTELDFHEMLHQARIAILEQPDKE